MQSESAALDAQVLLADVLGRPRAWVMAHPEAEVSRDQEEALSAALERLAAGEPLPYLLGRWEFYGLEFTVTPATLIPRPETELLVEQALAWLSAHPHRRRAADVGTGSGCIAVSLAKNIPTLKILGIDLSLEALRVARENATRHAVQAQVSLLQADLLAPLDGRFDLLVANLPYIPSQELARLPVAAWEPRLALDGGPQGLDAIRRLLGQAQQRLAEDGLLLLEIEALSGTAVQESARQAFPQAIIEVLSDLAGHQRLVKVQTV